MTDVVDVALTQARAFKVLPSLLNLFDTKLAQLPARLHRGALAQLDHQ